MGFLDPFFDGLGSVIKYREIGSTFNCSVRVCVVCVDCGKSLMFCRSSACRSILVVCSWDVCLSCCIICDVRCDVCSIILSSRALVSSVDIVCGKCRKYL